MKANELRIGNWFRYQAKIGYDYDVFDTKYIQDLVDDPQDDFFEPIPITEDILLKCGFIKDGNLYFKNGFVFRDDKLFYNTVELYLTINLHQLQNLYFSLTNEELTIKL